MSEYQLGSELQYKDKTWRVVRVISQDWSLFEDESGIYIIAESYVQIKSTDGEIDHVVLASDRMEYGGVHSNIKALKPLARNNNV